MNIVLNEFKENVSSTIEDLIFGYEYAEHFSTFLIEDSGVYGVYITYDLYSGDETKDPAKENILIAIAYSKEDALKISEIADNCINDHL